MNNEWKAFNDNKTKAGVEGRWKQDAPHRATFYIKGTNHGVDWKSNFRVLGRTEIDKGVKVNTRDLIEAQWIVEYIERVLDMNKISIFRISGHSRGGALASIVLWKLLRKYPTKTMDGILFAPKKAGNKKFTESVKAFITAYRHRGDIVPFLPLWPRYRNVPLTLFGDWKLVAHPVRNYRPLYNKYGLR